MTSLFEHLQTPGAIAVTPTDTVYGVVARAADPQAVANLYHLKRREGKPGTLVAASIEQLVELGLKRKYLVAVESLWPDALSVIIPCGPELEYLHQGVGSLAVRIPANERFRVLLQRTGPLLTSSANQPGEPPATTIEEAKAYFGDDVAWYEDGGAVEGAPSTVIRVSDDAIEVVRQGVVYFDEFGRKLEVE